MRKPTYNVYITQESPPDQNGDAVRNNGSSLHLTLHE